MNIDFLCGSAVTQLVLIQCGPLIPAVHKTFRVVFLIAKLQVYKMEYLNNEQTALQLSLRQVVYKLFESLTHHISITHTIDVPYKYGEMYRNVHEPLKLLCKSLLCMVLFVDLY